MEPPLKKTKLEVFSAQKQFLLKREQLKEVLSGSISEERFKDWGLDKKRFLNNFYDVLLLYNGDLQIAQSTKEGFFFIIKDNQVSFVHNNECSCDHYGTTKQLSVSDDTIIEKATGALQGVCTGKKIDAIGCLKTKNVHYIVAKTGNFFTYFKERPVQFAMKNYTSPEAGMVTEGPCTLGN